MSMTPGERKQLEALIDAIVDPKAKEHYQKQLAAADDLERDGLLDDRLPLVPILRGRDDEPVAHARTYVFQWFREGESGPCEQLVVHTAGSTQALALFEQNAASGTLVHAETVTPRCEILSLDAGDCRVCFGAGKVTPKGKQRSSTCEACAGSGKGQGS